MVIKSRYPELNLPSVDIYTFLFKRKDRKFPDEHRKSHSPSRSLHEFDANFYLIQQSSAMGQPTRHTLLGNCGSWLKPLGKD